MLRINNVTLEGPDLSGKTTLFEAIHSATGYRWNIQDRSELSMLCYAEMYGRNTDIWHKRLRNRLQNLNDRMIVVIPPLDVILDRYDKRGDDKQNKKSLIELYEIFKKNAKLYSDYPTMGLLEDIEGSVEEITALCISWLAECETSDIDEIANDVAEIASMSPTAFCRFFKTKSNKTFSQYLIEIRIGNACMLLGNENMTVEGACYSSGYNSLSNFHKHFKRMMRVSPTEYRTNILNI